MSQRGDDNPPSTTQKKRNRNRKKGNVAAGDGSTQNPTPSTSESSVVKEHSKKIETEPQNVPPKESPRYDQNPRKEAAPQQQNIRPGTQKVQQGERPRQQDPRRAPAPQQQTIQPGAANPSVGVGTAQAISKLTLKSSNEQAMVPVGNIPPNPLRSAIGNKGRRIMVESNHFRISMMKKLPTVIHYDVQITPNTPKALLTEVMEQFRKKCYPQCWPAFDSRCNLYSIKPLFDSKSIEGDISISDDNDSKPRNFRVVVTFAAYVDLTTLMNHSINNSLFQKELQCIGIVFNQAAAYKYVKVNRSYFTPSKEGRIVPLGNGMECWFGFFQSAILGWNKQLFLNVDVAHKAFPIEQPVIYLLAELSGCNVRDIRTINPENEMKLLSIIKGLKVVYEIPTVPSNKRVVRVVGFGKPPGQINFDADGKPTTVEKYFREVKKYRIHFPDLPCLHFGKTNFVPMELCTIVGGQITNRKLTEDQTRSMIRETATKPIERKNKIMTALKKVDLNNDPSLKEFGIKLEEKFTEIEARVLDPPTLEYSRKQTETPRGGVWRPSQFISSVPLTKWAIMTLEKYVRPHELQNFTEEVRKLGTRMLGMQIEKCSRIEERPIDPNRRQGIIEFFRSLQQQKYQLVFVVLPKFKTTQYYAMVKHTAEIDVGILTQCIQAKTIGRISPSTISNILLKVNAKLNGVNHCISNVSRPLILTKPVMIVGSDVTHPPPDQQDFPSVAAVAASHDPNAFKYNFLWRLQPPKTEIILDFQEIMREQLLYFYTQTRFKPVSIVVFRDGVSDGEFENVRHAELTAIRRACKSLQAAEYEPKITFVVVQKRHHTRLFPCNQRDADRNGNVLAGTCVDTVITHPTDQDFYLCSHASIQGTSRPTKYRVLWDDNKFTADDIQQLTYFLCHLYTRCTRSVSYPAPTYYAHLAAFRARHYLEQMNNFDLSKLLDLQLKNDVKKNISKDLPMYFV